MFHSFAVIVGLIWIASFLLSIPPVAAGDSFVNGDVCAAIPEQTNLSILIYVFASLFFVPVFLVTPFFVLWTRRKRSENSKSSKRLQKEDQENVSLNDHEIEESDNRKDSLSNLIMVSWLIQALCWTPFFVRLLLLTLLPPNASAAALEWTICLLGYSCGVLTSLTICAYVYCKKGRSARRTE